eukprot:scaffold341871_cov33-Prasinocladus_malaysianus.AAC.1
MAGAVGKSSRACSTAAGTGRNYEYGIRTSYEYEYRLYRVVEFVRYVHRHEAARRTPELSKSTSTTTTPRRNYVRNFNAVQSSAESVDVFRYLYPLAWSVA